MITRLIRLNANLVAFLSASLLGASVNLYTGALGGDQLPSRWRIILWSATATLVSSFAWAWVAWRLDAVQKAVARRPSGVSAEQARSVAANDRLKRRLAKAFIVACASSFLGLAPLPWGFYSQIKNGLLGNSVGNPSVTSNRVEVVTTTNGSKGPN